MKSLHVEATLEQLLALSPCRKNIPVSNHLVLLHRIYKHLKHQANIVTLNPNVHQCFCDCLGVRTTETLTFYDNLCIPHFQKPFLSSLFVITSSSAICIHKMHMVYKYRFNPVYGTWPSPGPYKDKWV